MRTSIFRIELALDGKVDFVKKTNPLGSAEDDKPDEVPKPVEKPDPAKAGKVLMGFLKGKQKKAA